MQLGIYLKEALLLIEKLRKMAFYLVLLVMSIILPGIAHYWLSFTKRAWFYPLTLLLGIALIGWSKLIFTAYGEFILLFWCLLVYCYALAEILWLTTRHPSRGKVKAWWKTGLFVCISVPTILVAIIFKNLIFGFQFYQIPSGSMLPTLRPGDVVLADTFGVTEDSLQPGNIVVFKRRSDANTYYIKRIIATPGQTVEIEDGKLKIDEVIIEEAIKPANLSKKTIGESGLFVMGDNANHSYDSRYWGEVAQDDVVAIYRKTIFSRN